MSLRLINIGVWKSISSQSGEAPTPSPVFDADNYTTDKNFSVLYPYVTWDDCEVVEHVDRFEADRLDELCQVFSQSARFLSIDVEILENKNLSEDDFEALLDHIKTEQAAKKDIVIKKHSKRTFLKRLFKGLLS